MDASLMELKTYFFWVYSRKKTGVKKLKFSKRENFQERHFWMG